MANLGQFADVFSSFRRMLAAVPSSARLPVFLNAAEEAAGYVSRGLDRAIAADELTDMALAHGLDDADAIQWVIAHAFEVIEELERVPDDIEEEKPKTNGRTHAPSATLYVVPDPATIPPRAWLSAMHYMRGVVTATVAPGGFGKTTLALFEALEMVTEKGLRVWYISGEDDRIELDRRIAAHCKVHDVSATALGNRLFVDDKMTFPFKIAKSSHNGPVFDQTALAVFEQTIKVNEIDVVILDPFVAFHLLSENDTSAMDALVKRLGEICFRQQCGIEISHHVRKPTGMQMEITVYDARGAVAIVNAVRSCRVLNHMTESEAERAEIAYDDHRFFVRIDGGKRNMAPPEKARWAQLVSIEIANGDNVQALKPFEYKATRAAILKPTEEDEKWVRTLLKTKSYRKASKSPDWLGNELAQHFGCDLDIKGDVLSIVRQLKQWVTKGIIAEDFREDEHRKMRPYYVHPDEQKIQEKANQDGLN